MLDHSSLVNTLSPFLSYFLITVWEKASNRLSTLISGAGLAGGAAGGATAAAGVEVGVGELDGDGERGAEETTVGAAGVAIAVGAELLVPATVVEEPALAEPRTAP